MQGEIVRFCENPENIAKKDGACVLYGADQGFHNYLLHTGRLGESIDSVSVFPQGEGPVNNIGSLHRNWELMTDRSLDEDFQLREWPSGHILNWDLATRSPVVHQLDRFFTEKSPHDGREIAAWVYTDLFCGRFDDWVSKYRITVDRRGRPRPPGDVKMPWEQ